MPKNSFDKEYYQKKPEFQNLLRLIGTSIEGHRKIAFGLSQIRGVGLRLADAVVRVSGLDPELRIGLLTEPEQQQLVEIIRNPVKHGIPKWMVNRQKDLRTGENRHITGNDLVLVTKMDIDRMKRVRSWKGIRHMYNLKVRGQRTRTTGRHGLVVGYLRKQLKERK
ncbi:MAG: 30S ribosomal protein S13 [Promethearchaeota archaeon]